MPFPSEKPHSISFFKGGQRKTRNLKGVAGSRRGAQEVAGLVADLCSAVDATRTAITCHMEREEADVLPLLQERLCASQQRDMVWRTLCAMPLRLLERVLPWLAGARFAFPVFAAS